MNPKWLFNVLILLGMWQNGKKNRLCFVLSGLGEAGWTVASASEGQWDLAFICAVFCCLCVYNYRKWGQDKETK